jgi:SdiA-regulated
MINLDKNMNNAEAKIKTLPVWMLLSLGLLLLAGCESKRVIYTPTGYDITHPDPHDLGTKLNEISGICWINDSLMLANNDEAGKIFAINLSNLNDFEYRNVKFGAKEDYEDIVKVDASIYLLISTGEIVKVTNYNKEESVQSTVVAKLEGKENEFESLYYDKEINSLIMLCKKCHKEKDKFRSAFRFDLQTNTLIDTPYYQIDMDIIRKKMDDSRAEFRPSAAAVNPMDNKIYIVSSIGRLMVVINKKGKVEQAFGISSTMFPQPEGIAFAENGDMYISNEVGAESRATLLRFPYKKPG